MQTQRYKVINKDLINNINTMSQFSSNANKFSCEVICYYNDNDREKADVKSILGLLSFVLKNDDFFAIKFDGKDELQAKEKITTFLLENGITTV